MNVDLDEKARRAVDEDAKPHKPASPGGGKAAANGAAHSAARSGGSPPERLRLVKPSEMDWRGAQLNLVKGIIGHGMFALLYGDSGSAKTLMAIDLAMHVALARPWCGRKVRGGFVAYVCPEGPHSVHLRFHAWCLHHAVDPHEDAIPFRTIPAHVDLCKGEADTAEIVARVKAAEPELGPCKLVVVDTVSRALAGGNENGPEDMGAFVGHCRRIQEGTGATVLAVHHKPRGGDTPRGHTSLTNAADVRLDATKLAGGVFSMTLVHVKDGFGGAEIVFKLERELVGRDADKEPVFGGLVVESDVKPAGEVGRPKGNGLTTPQLLAIKAFRDEADRTRVWEISKDTFRDLCTRCGAIDPTDKDARGIATAANRLMQQLAARNLIAIDGATLRLRNQS